MDVIESDTPDAIAAGDKVLSTEEQPEKRSTIGRVPRPVLERFVCEEFELTKEQFYDRTHKIRIVRPRQVYFFLARLHTKLSLPQIAKDFKMHHTTVHYGVERVKELLVVDTELAGNLARLRACVKTYVETRNATVIPVGEQPAV